MKRLLYLALLPALLAACSKLSDQSPQGQYDRAMKQVGRLEFVKAESTFVQLQRADSVTPLADRGLAQTYEQKLWWLDALGHYLRLLDKRAEMAEAEGGAVRCFYNLGSYFDASRTVERWVTLAPDDVQPYYWQALTLIQTMDLAGASQALRKAEEKGLDGAAARLLEARIKWLQGSYDAAISTAAQGIGARSKADEYFVALADYYAERGIPDSAVSAARQGYDENPSPFTAWRCLDFCDRYQRFWAARRLLSDWDARDKEKSVSEVLHFYSALAADDRSKLTVMPDQILVKAPGAVTSLVLSALAYRALYSETVSADFLDQATTVACAGLPESFKEYIGAYVGYSYARSYNRDGAAQQLLAVKGWRTDTREFRAAIYTQMTISGGVPQAEKMWDTLGPLHGRDPIWLTAFGDAYANAKGVPFRMGQKFYRMALDVAPTYRPAFVGMVRMAIATGSYQEAINAFDSMNQFGPMSPELTDLKTIALAGVGRTDEAIALFKQSFSQYPQDIATARKLVDILGIALMPEKIRDLMQFCVGAAKDNPDAYELAARALLDWGYADEGLQTARSGLALEADNLRLQAQEARGLYATGRKDEAKAAFDRILAEDQTQGEAAMYYSLALAESGADARRAELMAQHALVMVAPDLYPAKNLAKVYFALGRYINSREALLRAAVISPKDPQVWYLMGMCQYHEKLPEARESLQKSIALGLTGDSLTKAQEALRQL
ncbi:hypothetical protein C3F09_07075 [candidate division GN15 bacterium]|uniref:Tetratricopeptide repeat protein n=1 Tax=candidate division GN15 bacterium TaxID=2072418 RepID=A0A855X5M9_9BACT|nr:MAG: hypothetical protein C3F09_07075 [candidate division GN15 bacterium]